MKLTAPDYYPQFKCIAGKCKHNCCIGWEIDIDDETYAKYASVPGEFGRRLHDGIDTSGDAPCFRMDKNSRCAFLNDENLCEIIIHMGENHLCQICADHPRFRNFFADRTQIGLGLCCEAAAQLILGQRQPVCEITLEDDGTCETLCPEEENILALQREFTAIAQAREFSIDDRLNRLLHAAEISLPDFSIARWAQVFADLEQLSPDWNTALHMLQKSEEICPEFSDPDLEIPFEQLLVYFLYRHIPAAQDEADAALFAAFCVLAVKFISALCAAHRKSRGACTPETLCEYARMFSSEIEYSDENIDILLDLLDR